MQFEPIKAVAFDFDGVILDSARIKTEAFIELYSDHPECIDKIREYHLANQGISRFVKFRWIANSLIGKSVTDQELDALSQRFSTYTLNRILQAPFVSGAEKLLTYLHSCGLPSFIASGTPERELRDIVQRRNLSGYFQAVYGSPRTKTQILQTIMSEADLNPLELLMIGDATSDHQAAVEIGCQFLAVWTEELSDYWRSVNARTTNDLSILMKLISK